jgi:hypothetical protein
MDNEKHQRMEQLAKEFKVIIDILLINIFLTGKK